MRYLSVILLAAGLLQATPALSKSSKRKPRVVKVTPTGEASAAEPARVEPRAARNAPAMTVEAPSSRRFVTDGGNPAPGRVLLSPMFGGYAISGIEYGAKLSVQVLDHGFVPALNNSVSVEAGAFKGTWHGFFGKSESLFYTATGRWDFHLHPSWTVFGGAGLLYEKVLTIADIPQDEVEIEPTLVTGGMLVLTDNLRLRAEFDSASASYRFGVVAAL